MTFGIVETPGVDSGPPCWLRDVYRDAVWASGELAVADRAIAETYARHARDARGADSADADLSSLTYEQIMAEAGIGRRATVAVAIASLVKTGWLTIVQESGRRPTLFRLTVPLGPDGVGLSAGRVHTHGRRRAAPDADVIRRFPNRAVVTDAASGDRSTARVTALYRWFDADDQLLYVGVTYNMAERVLSHDECSSWSHFAARCTVERFPDRASAEDAEVAAIKSEQPLFNQQHNDTPEARQRLADYLIEKGRTDLLAPAISRG